MSESRLERGPLIVSSDRYSSAACVVVANDLRTPLHTIAVGLETLLELQPPNDERAARQLVISNAP